MDGQIDRQIDSKFDIQIDRSKGHKFRPKGHCCDPYVTFWKPKGHSILLYFN